MSHRNAKAARIARRVLPCIMSVLFGAKTTDCNPCNGIPEPKLITAINDSSSESSVQGAIGAINESLVNDQEWVRLTPKGAFPNPRGLQVVDDTSISTMVEGFNSLAARVQRLFRGLPIYEGHPDDPEWAKNHPGAKADAVGRIKELQGREDGLYARVAYNDAGKTMITGEAAPYSNQSPRWGMVPITYQGKKAFRPVVLMSVGLTNQPNIPDTQIGLNDATAAAPELSPDMKDKLLKLLALFGQTIAADAPDDQIAAAIDAAIPVASTAVAASSDLKTSKDQSAASCNEATTLKAQLAAERSARADQVVTSAINEGRLPEASRAEWQGKLVASPDFTATAKELSALKTAINTTPLVKDVGGRRKEAVASNDRIAAINSAVKVYQDANPNVEYTTAFQEVKKTQPALFAT